jgi:hypothetical protein
MRLYAVLEEGLSDIHADDLGVTISVSEWKRTVAALREIEDRSAAERVTRSREAANGGRALEDELIRDAYKAVDGGRPEAVDWERIARTTLYRRKRAATLADLVRALGTLRNLGWPSAVDALERALETEEGTRAVECALRRLKQRIIASSVMELTTCGAVPPYRDILGGKLVAILMLSRQVAEHFADRYAGRVSLIASALAARPVVRRARLALITTSSLYPVGSTQYNRIKVPLPGGTLGYRRIGATQSFGTVHLAPDTVALLGEVARLSEERREAVHNLFGEGTSPKLRLIRAGLDALGLRADTFLRHHSPRLIYAAALCRNIDEVVLGLTEEPDYLLPPGPEGLDLLIEHWRTRWLSRRAGRADILEKVRKQRFERLRLSLELEELTQAPPAGRAATMRDRTSRRGKAKAESRGGGDPTFVERLYRSTKSYADRLSQDELDAIHVDFGVDAYLLEQAEAGREIIVTGNPGDGKTHLIERLRPRLEALGARVITDANACSDKEILDTWQSC